MPTEAAPWDWRRMAGIAAMVFAVLFVITVAFEADAPAFDDPIDEIREYYVDNDTGLAALAWVQTLLVFVLFLPFASALRSLLTRADPDDGMWARLSFSGAVLAVAVAGAGTVFTDALLLGSAATLSDGALQAFAQANDLIYMAVSTWGFALFAAAAAVVILRTAVLWTWLGWLGLVSALLMVVGALWPIDGDSDGALFVVMLVAQPIWVVWVFLTGMAMIRQPAQN